MQAVEYGMGGERIIRLDARDSRHVLSASPEDFRDAVRYSKHMRHLGELARRGDRFPGMRAAASGEAGYVVHTGTSALALSGATAKTVMYVNGGTKAATFCEMSIAFDGTTATNVPALIDLCYGTKASNSTPGTASTTFTPVQTRGWASGAASSAAANACSSEPTVLTVTRTWLTSPNGGILIIQWPLGREPVTLQTAATSGLQIAVRCNAPNAVNIRGYLEFAE